MNVKEINVLVLAYLGDSIYEEYIRKFLINKGISNVNDLQTQSIKYVSAKAQSYFLDKIINSDLVNDDDLSVIKRARNYKSSRHPKNCDILTYKHATALEALIGYLEFINNKEKINKIMNFIFSLEDIC